MGEHDGDTLIVGTEASDFDPISLDAKAEEPLLAAEAQYNAALNALSAAQVALEQARTELQIAERRFYDAEKHYVALRL